MSVNHASLEKESLDREFHTKFAKASFNFVWTLLEKKERTVEEKDDMVNAAHASRYHWGIVGTPIHFARGEWQISRVYSVIHQPHAAIYHAEKCLQICLDNGIGDFDIAYAYEALARAYHVLGQIEQRDRFIDLGKIAGQLIEKEPDRKLFFSDIEDLQ